MSSFTCEICGAQILDTEKGYITGCEHYPLMGGAVSKKNKTEILELLIGLRGIQGVIKKMQEVTITPVIKLQRR